MYPKQPLGQFLDAPLGLDFVPRPRQRMQVGEKRRGLGRGQNSFAFASRDGRDVLDGGSPLHGHPVVTLQDPERVLPVQFVNPEGDEGGCIPEVHRRPSRRSSERSSSRASSIPAPGRKG